jgi:hypothetical protein
MVMSVALFIAAPEAGMAGITGINSAAANVLLTFVDRALS